MRIYFDICAIQRPLRETGQFELVASAAHEMENGQNPYPERQAHASDVLALARHRVPSSPEVAERTSIFV